VRIAVLSTSYPRWDGQAAGHFVAAEAAALCQQGHEVVVIAPGPRNEVCGTAPLVSRLAAGDSFGPPGVLARLRERPSRVWGALAFCWRARRELERRGPFDQIVAHWLLPCAWPIASGKAPTLEVVAHGSDVRLFCRLPSALRRHIARSWLDRQVRLRCVSRELRDLLIEASHPALAAQTRVEPVPLVLGTPPGRAVARERLGVGEGTRLALLVARLVPEKRVAAALRALVHLPGIALVVVGGGPLLSELRRDFPTVRFTGELERPRALEWIAAADVLVSASLREGSPTALREARALGVPIVAQPAGDLRAWAAGDPGVWLV
jgi:teichuronic acid biosynthesis glycosyltransferase TuaC